MVGRLSKILLVTLEYPPDRGGVSRYYGEIVRHWQGEISILKPRFWLFWPHWLPLLWQVGRQVKKEKIEMLWVGQVLPLGYIGWWLKKRKKIPYVVFTHGMDILLPQKSWWKKMWLKKILSAADLVVANSEFTRGEVLKLGVEKGRTMAVYPCPSPLLRKEGSGEVDSSTPPSENVQQLGKSLLRHSERSEESLKLAKRTNRFFGLWPQNDVIGHSRDKIILSVGRLVKRKGFDKVIETMPRILKRIPEAKYIIIGNGPEKENLKSKISAQGGSASGGKNLKLEEKVLILENVDDEELVNWYNQCHVLAMPCRQIEGDVEGFGLVFLEAASFGKPVVAGRSGGASEAVHHGYGGYVVNPESDEELYQALVKLLTDENFAERMGEYGREWVKNGFKWENEIQKLKDVILSGAKDPVN